MKIVNLDISKREIIFGENKYRVEIEYDNLKEFINIIRITELILEYNEHPDTEDKIIKEKYEQKCMELDRNDIEMTPEELKAFGFRRPIRFGKTLIYIARADGALLLHIRGYVVSDVRVYDMSINMYKKENFEQNIKLIVRMLEGKLSCIPNNYSWDLLRK